MKLTPFGEAARVLRMKYGLSLKQMAEAMSISSPYLSSIEFGEKRLAQKHIDSATAFFKDKVSLDQLNNLLDAAERSKQIIDTADLSNTERGFVAAFARKLQEGSTPTPEIMSWLNNRSNNQD
jgi:transcriptional regulator with XRE-family HTH domain